MTVKELIKKLATNRR